MHAKEARKGKDSQGPASILPAWTMFLFYFYFFVSGHGSHGAQSVRATGCHTNQVTLSGTKGDTHQPSRPRRSRYTRCKPYQWKREPFSQNSVTRKQPGGSVWAPARNTAIVTTATSHTHMVGWCFTHMQYIHVWLDGGASQDRCTEHDLTRSSTLEGTRLFDV